MLVEFQTALAELTASPALCRAVRRSPELLRDRYDLTDKEWRRLTSIVSSKGMEANCMLYRANRLAPVALNLPETCAALGDDLTGLISSYWDAEPTTDVNFLVEADRFATYLETRHHEDLAPPVRTALATEHAHLSTKLAAARTARAGWG